MRKKGGRPVKHSPVWKCSCIPEVGIHLDPTQVVSIYLVGVKRSDMEVQYHLHYVCGYLGERRRTVGCEMQRQRQNPLPSFITTAETML